MSAPRGASPASPSPPPPRPPRSPLRWLKSPRRSPSPDSTCPICLSDLVNKSVTNTCMHEFCFCCLLEWSKIKAECPLCKQRFSKIYHTIKSMDVYEEHVLEQAGSSAGGIGILDPILINFHILTNARLQAPLMLLFPPREHSTRNSRIGGISGPNAPPPPESVVARRRIYDQNLWALPLRSQRNSWGVRVRESSPEFYRLNPAQTHRLIPWLLRELHVLLGTTTVDISTLIHSILEEIQIHPIRSRYFASRVRTYLADTTPHFVHEFYSFAVAPFDMDLYDMCVEYTSFNNSLALSTAETASDSDSDVEIVPSLSVVGSTLNLPSSSSTANHSTQIARPSSVRLRSSATSSTLDSATTFDSSSPFFPQSLDDEGGNSSVSTLPASPVPSSPFRFSPEVIVIASSPSYVPSSPSHSPRNYSSDSDIEMLSPPRRPPPIVITLDDSSEEEEEKKLGVKVEQSPEAEPVPEDVAGPSTSTRYFEVSPIRCGTPSSPSDSMSSSSKEHSTRKPVKTKKKRKIKSKKRLPPKKRSRCWETSDDSETEDDYVFRMALRESKNGPRRSHRLASNSSFTSS